MMLSRSLSGLCVLALAVTANSSQAEAQMFGNRQLGGFLSRQSQSSGVSNPAEAMIHSSGSLTGTERFLRANRRVTDFIGFDTGEQRRFVGQTHSRTLSTPLFVPPPLPGPVVPEVNRMPNAGNAAQRPYPPQLTLSPGR